MSEEFVVSMVFRGNDQISRPAQQMNRALTDMSRNQREASRTSQELNRETSMLGGVMKTAFAAFTLGAVKNFAEEFNELGVQVRANRTIFEQLTGVWGDSDRTLQRLRGSTMGVVDDMTLMAGASQLLRLNIVDTEGDLSDLVGQIQRLKQPTESMESAISNFSMMLANESKLRLDSFGISSANVTRRMEELGESFREATMHEMAASIERLGDAANVSETALARMGTAFTNFTQNAAEGFAAVLERGLTALDQIITLANNGALGALFGEDVIGNREAASLEAEAQAKGQVIADAFLQGFLGDVDPAIVRNYINGVTQAMLESMQAGSGGLLWESQLQELMFNATGMTIPADSSYYTDFLAISDEVYRQLSLMQQAEEVNAQQLETSERQLAVSRAMSEYRRQEVRYANEIAEAAEREAARNERLDPLYEVYSQLSTMTHEANVLRGGMFFTEAESATANRLIEQFDYLLDNAKTLHDQGLISDEDFAKLREMGGQARDWANEVERGAEALRNLTLSQVFGQSGGGLLGEISSQLLAGLGERGLEGDALQEITDALNLASGVETASSIAMRDEVLPLLEDIYFQFGEDAAVQAARSFSEGLRSAQIDGTEITPEMLAELTGFQRIAGGGRQIQVNPGDNLYSLANQYGGSIEDYRWLLDGNGFLQPGSYGEGGGVERIPSGLNSGFGFGATDMAAATADMAINAPVAAGAFSEITTEVAQAEQHATGLKSAIEEIASQTHKVDIELNVKYPAILDLLLGDGAGGLGNTVRANGGRVPGADPRGRQLER